MKKAIFIDIDNTLLDFDKCAYLSMKLFLYAAFMGIIENLFNLGLLVKSLALNKVVRYHQPNGTPAMCVGSL